MQAKEILVFAVISATTFSFVLGAVIPNTDIEQEDCPISLELPCLCGDTNTTVLFSIPLCVDFSNRECVPCDSRIEVNDWCKRFEFCAACDPSIDRCLRCPEGRSGDYCEKAMQRKKRQTDDANDYDNKEVNIPDEGPSQQGKQGTSAPQVVSPTSANGNRSAPFEEQAPLSPPTYDNPPVPASNNMVPAVPAKANPTSPPEGQKPPVPAAQQPAAAAPPPPEGQKPPVPAAQQPAAAPPPPEGVTKPAEGQPAVPSEGKQTPVLGNQNSAVPDEAKPKNQTVAQRANVAEGDDSTDGKNASVPSEGTKPPIPAAENPKEQTPGVPVGSDATVPVEGKPPVPAGPLAATPGQEQPTPTEGNQTNLASGPKTQGRSAKGAVPAEQPDETLESEVNDKCTIPDEVSTMNVRCNVTTLGVYCDLQCIWGYAFNDSASFRSISCAFKENVWKQHKFQECQPIVDCNLILVSPGWMECTVDRATDPSFCEIACAHNASAYSENKKYFCNLDGTFTPELPPCVSKEALPRGNQTSTATEKEDYATDVN